MAKKYHFRKVYFICEDKSIFTQQYEMVNCYRNEDYARKVCAQQQQLRKDDLQKLWAKKDAPLRALTAHGFYLVHESLFEEFLKEHSKK